MSLGLISVHDSGIIKGMITKFALDLCIVVKNISRTPVIDQKRKTLFLRQIKGRNRTWSDFYGS